MRVCVATAHRLPELSRMVDRMVRDGCVARIVCALAGASPAPSVVGPATSIAERFIDMVFVPQQMRALIGGDREQLDAAATRRIDDAIELLFCSGLLDAFEAGSGKQKDTVDI